MHLSAFIDRDMEAILSAWADFARTLLAGRPLGVAALRDHARDILRAICRDVVTPQTRNQQDLKPKGVAQALDTQETAAQTHAGLRARCGFDINEMVAEYRALRASVLRLWADACAPAAPDLEELIRFNEGIDQALCASIRHLSNEVERARDLLLGVIGHDMRNPLNCIQLKAKYLQGLNAGVHINSASGRLVRSSLQLTALLNDLMDFNRTRLGLGIPIHPEATDLARVFEDELEELRASFPERNITLKAQGFLRGNWDANRIHQVLGNLVANALRYGSASGTVHVELTGLESKRGLKAPLRRSRELSTIR